VPSSEAWWRRDGRRVAAAEFVEQRPRLGGRRDAQLRPQAFGELATGSQRCSAVAAGGEPLDQSAVRCFRERIEGHLGTGEADGLAGVIGAGSGPLERLCEQVRMLVACLEGLVLVEVVEDRRTACLERTHRVAFVEREPEGAGIDPEVRSVERHGVPRGDEVVRRRP
jgi:hypothetical protein